VQRCNNCNKATLNPKYCSRSCSASTNNYIKPKRKRKRQYCKQCKKLIDAPSKRYLCDYCNQLKLIDHKTKEQLQPNAESKIRSNARTIARKHFEEPWTCSKCNYVKHVQVCHKTAIKDFPDNTAVFIINAIHNLELLCPNCHWETDNL